MLSTSKTNRRARFRDLFTTLTAIALFTLPGLANAQDNEDVIVHEFGDADLVEGHLQSSDMAFLMLRSGIRHRPSLIRPRVTFVPELLKSCEDSR